MKNSVLLWKWLLNFILLFSFLLSLQKRLSAPSSSIGWIFVSPLRKNTPTCAWQKSHLTFTFIAAISHIYIEFGFPSGSAPVTRIIGDMWKTLDPKLKQRYEEEYQINMKQVAAERKRYEASYGRQVRSKNSKKVKNGLAAVRRFFDHPHNAWTSNHLNIHS